MLAPWSKNQKSSLFFEDRYGVANETYQRGHIQSMYLTKSGKNMYVPSYILCSQSIGICTLGVNSPYLNSLLPACGIQLPWSLSLFLCLGSYSM